MKPIPAQRKSLRGDFPKESLDKPAIHRYNIHVFGPVAQLGERTVQFYAPKFGDVAQASGRWFASMPPKKSIRACSSAGRAFGSHPRGREFESLQVHHQAEPKKISARKAQKFQRLPGFFAPIFRSVTKRCQNGLWQIRWTCTFTQGFLSRFSEDFSGKRLFFALGKT